MAVREVLDTVATGLPATRMFTTRDLRASITCLSKPLISFLRPIFMSSLLLVPSSKESSREFRALSMSWSHSWTTPQLASVKEKSRSSNERRSSHTSLSGEERLEKRAEKQWRTQCTDGRSVGKSRSPFFHNRIDKMKNASRYRHSTASRIALGVSARTSLSCS